MTFFGDRANSPSIRRQHGAAGLHSANSQFNMSATPSLVDLVAAGGMNLPLPETFTQHSSWRRNLEASRRIQGPAEGQRVSGACSLQSLAGILEEALRILEDETIFHEDRYPRMLPPPVPSPPSEVNM
jgi:hypothetical protein